MSGKAKSRIISGHSPPSSRHVTERAGPRPSMSPVPNVGARATTQKFRRHLEAPGRGSIGKRPKSAFLSGRGGLSLRKQQRKPPGLSVAGSNRQVTGRQAAQTSNAKSRIISGDTPPKSRIISGDTPPGRHKLIYPPAACREAVCWGHHLRPRYKTSMLRKE